MGSLVHFHVICIKGSSNNVDCGCSLCESTFGQLYRAFNEIKDFFLSHTGGQCRIHGF